METLASDMFVLGVAFVMSIGVFTIIVSIDKLVSNYQQKQRRKNIADLHRNIEV
jgi:site-specific recombinase